MAATVASSRSFARSTPETSAPSAPETGWIVSERGMPPILTRPSTVDKDHPGRGADSHPRGGAMATKKKAKKVKAKSSSRKRPAKRGVKDLSARGTAKSVKGGLLP